MTPPPLPRIRVAAVIVKDGQVLLVRHEKDGQTYWLLPGGGVDAGETLHEALVREVREETGLAIRPGRLLLVADGIPPDGHRHIVHLCFAAEAAGGTAGVSQDPRVTESRYTPLSALETIDFRPAIGTALTKVLYTPPPPTPAYLGNIWRG